MHDSLEQAIRLINLPYNTTNRQSLTPSVKKSNKKRSSTVNLGRSATALQPSATSAQQSQSNSQVPKRRPVARSIGIAADVVPSKFDLVYYEESPDFCVPSESYNIKGTKGRICSENQNASNSCDRLCCGRGYKTEVRVENYKCECQFKFCCDLDCKTCVRRKVIYKCL